MKNKILVIYIGVQGIRIEDIEYYTNKIAKKIIPSTFQGEIIVIPVQSSDTRIECINPEYITRKNLINKHTKLMEKLEEELQHQLKELKKDNNE
jgi:hypothetical protein